MSFPCAYCEKEVRPRQHAFECETCSCWQHRLCDTGVSLADYRRLMSNEIEMFFECCNCSPVLECASEWEPVVEDKQHENERDIGLVAALEESLGPASVDLSIPDLSFNISLPFYHKIVKSDSDDSSDSDTSDSSIDNPVQSHFAIKNLDQSDSSSDESITSDSSIEDRPVTFEVVEGGTMRKAKKLVSSDGYSYTVKNSTSRTIHWKCSVRNKNIYCKATVAQRGQNFIRGIHQHIHRSDPNVVQKTKLRAELMTEAALYTHKSAGAIVKEKMHTISGRDVNLPNPTNLTRAINRLRQERRLKEPTDLNLRYVIKAKICQ
ncbi:uncharacterized protein LOC134718107 [Mytilus trossulus]|uniref:uncharacterized protein LOC134718107 n=1 Tax=Mytilus trossulus TaxID=6551 RepID=UPI0030050375